MAIIICPECGEKISDTINQCVHCGVKITICPECRKIHKGALSVCTECGFEIERPQAERLEFKNSKELVSRWEQGGVINKYVYTNYVNLGISVATVLLLAIAVIRLILCFDSTPSTGIITTINILLVLFVIVSIIRSIYSNLCEHIKTIMLTAWCKQNNVDLENTISETLKLNFDSLTVEAAGDMLGTAQWCCRALAFAKNDSIREKSKRQNIIKIFLSSITAIFLCVFISSNTHALVGGNLFGSGLEFSEIVSWWTLIVTAIAFIANRFIGNDIEKAVESCIIAQINQSMPSLLNSYKSYVSPDEMANYILKRSGLSDE